jgi:excisionase family DNA binding protein
MENHLNQATHYSPAQVAQILGYKVSSIYAAISRKELGSNKIGAKRIITHSQLNQFLARRNDRDLVIDYTRS